MNKDEELRILCIESPNKLSNSSTNYFNFEIYSFYGEKFDNLSVCENTQIEISSPIIDLNLINYNEAITFLNQGYDIYNEESDFYNDICTPAYINNSDIIIKDRQNDIFPNNITLCDNNCEYNGIDLKKEKNETVRISCKCNIKNNIDFFPDLNLDYNKLKKKFIDIKSITNIGIIKCYKLLFTKKGIQYNIGNYLISSIIIILFALLLIFIFKGYKTFVSQFYDMIRKNKTLKEKKTIKMNVILTKKKKLKKKNKRNTINISKANNNIVINSNIKLNSNYSTKLKEAFNELKTEKSDKRKNKEKSINKKNNLNYNNYELNTLSYKEAIMIDKRTYLQYYFSLLKTKHLLVFTFYTYNDYNSKIIKIYLFFFSFSLYLVVNALFFNDSTMHEIYKEEGYFDFIYHLPQILYSTIISTIINTIIKYLSLTETKIIEIKKEKESIKEKPEKELKCFLIKFIIFFILSFLFSLFFWYYLSCFCAVYKKTQIHLIKDTLISFGLSMIYPLGLNLLPGIFRIPSLRYPNNEILYIISKVLQVI